MWMRLSSAAGTNGSIEKRGRGENIFGNPGAREIENVKQRNEGGCN